MKQVHRSANKISEENFCRFHILEAILGQKWTLLRAHKIWEKIKNSKMCFKLLICTPMNLLWINFRKIGVKKKSYHQLFGRFFGHFPYKLLYICQFSCILSRPNFEKLQKKIWVYLRSGWAIFETTTFWNHKSWIYFIKA